MAQLLHEAWFPLLICLMTSASCSSISKPGVISQPPSHLFRITEQGVRKPGPRRRLVALQEKETVFPFAVGKRGNPGQEIQRVRRSLLADYMDDLWTHIRESIPRAALYAFPLALGVILFLCCVTVLLD